MKPLSSRFSKRQPRGFALVIILSVLVLLLALVVGFFSRVQNELQRSNTYQSAGSARNLADYAVNMVLTQIKAGTSGKNASGAVLGWASQPGAIRTFDTSGGLVSVYKLYSSNEMVVSSVNAATEANSLAGWYSNPALFTDLNEPLNNQYPILDPTAAGYVKGFSITGAPVATTASPNTAPMPARWLYVLKDGQIVSPGGSGNSANIAGASSSNPIVGRIAFWTDDDSSKININTAAGGPWDEPNINVSYKYGSSDGSILQYSGPGFNGFWGTPIAFSKQEGIMAGNQPVKWEFQRYPGHPANTFLSAALPELDTSDKIFSVASRLENQGSLGGSTLTTTPVRLDTDRLYQSVDELIFQKNRTVNTGLNKASIERAKFFLTAQSRSPDVNLFNEPRISIWPIDASVAKRTPYDKLIAFCETINGSTYYFTRQNPNDATSDISINRNRQILSYLNQKTAEAVPGFSGAGGVLGKYGADRAQILTEIFDYIRTTNTKDSSMTASSGSVDSSYFYSPTGAVVPSRDGLTKGFGRFPTLNKASLLIYGVAQNAPGGSNAYVAGERNEIGPPGFEATLPADGKMRMGAILLFEMFNPAQGYGKVYPRMQVTATITAGFQWPDGTSMFKSDTGTFNFASDADWNYGVYSTPWGGRIGTKMLVGYFSRNANATSYPFASDPNPITGNLSPEIDMGTNFPFNGGTVNIRISGPGGSPLIQSYDIVFPGGSESPVQFPAPSLAPLVAGDSGERDFRRYEQRLNTTSHQAWNSWITNRDVVRSTSVKSGDFRLLAGQTTPSISMFEAHPYYYRTDKPRAHNLIETYPVPYFGGTYGTYAPISKANYSRGGNRDTISSSDRLVEYIGSDYTMGILASSNSHLADNYSTDGVFVGGTGTILGDWDNAVGRYSDGPYINFADEGYVQTGVAGGSAIPYFSFIESYTELGPSFFTPNRMMPSAVMFGSLSTGVLANSPWQTLLFRPQAGHPGAQNTPDYVLLDFFNMPVVEPYAISEPLSTAGRVNMNYQILPYNYIERSTAVQAVLRSEQMLAISNSDANRYKTQTSNAGAIDTVRYKLNLDKVNGTLRGFEDRFQANDIFRSPGEICSLWLVPNTTGATYNTMTNWWDSYLPTGDNSKEASYARIYPRFTTKSNTYTVHYRVQVLKKPANSANQAQWVEGTDKTQAEFRGSTTIERYVDPNDSGIPDYITTSNPPLDSFYKFRVLSQKQFNP